MENWQHSTFGRTPGGAVIGDAPGGLPVVDVVVCARPTDSGSGFMHAGMRYGHLSAIPTDDQSGKNKCDHITRPNFAPRESSDMRER